MIQSIHMSGSNDLKPLGQHKPHESNSSHNPSSLSFNYHLNSRNHLNSRYPFHSLDLDMFICCSSHPSFTVKIHKFMYILQDVIYKDLSHISQIVIGGVNSAHVIIRIDRSWFENGSTVSIPRLIVLICGTKWVQN